ncbi:choice-of-anchor D domain-containing protein [Luteolibacter luteus]|uniref:Choice-of-anchor D domain-containing protein n=1 Tax=Luteolibacter luteus TaxID=2728835 RepID=A0A858RKM9_9BACT|nr:choice-of-anchor D domain-containing protein [Luteolibacter luteus]QJE97054.1 choice-of-anchor D domain-containing protein [Luteolibacter luteus]
MSGSVAVVGSPLFDENPISALDCGVVKIYDTANGNLLQRLKSPSGTPFGYFGGAVAISGTKVIVGSDEPVGDDSGSGRVHVYDIASAAPSVPVFTFNNPASSKRAQFGHSVAIDGNLIVVGAWLDDAGETNSGRAYVYDIGSSSPTDPVLVLENPGPAENDCFGVSVAVSGSKVAVAAYHDGTGGSKAGRVYVFDVDGQVPGVPWMSLGKPNSERNDCFGNSLAMSGSLLAVGAEASDADAWNSGNAYIFDLASGTPTQPLHTLSNPVPQAQGYFGTSVSISGNLLTVGAYRNDTPAANTGACYVFDLGGVTPTVPSVVLSRPTADEDDYFGNAVSISGNRIVVGAWRDDTGDLDSGISYVYDLSGEIPANPVAALDSPHQGSADHFGSAVSISGDLVVVGSPDSDSGATRAGRVSVHDLASSKPSATLAFIENPTPAFNDAFGAAVAASAPWIVIGAPGDDAGAPNAGSVYSYNFSAGPATSPAHVLPNPAPEAGDGFGTAVAVSGSLVAVGSPLDDMGAVDSGVVHVFDLSSENPAVPVFIIPNPTPAVDDRFGCSVGISGTRLIVGAMRDDVGATNSGTAYVFDLDGNLPTIPWLTLSNPSPAAEDGFGNAVAVFFNRVVVAASADDTGATDAGSVYVYDLGAATPHQPVFTIPNPSPSNDDRFGQAVAVAEPRVVVGAHLDNSPTDSGRAYTFNMVSATPTIPSATLAKNTPTNGDQFGSSVGVSGSIVVVGVPLDNKTATDKGAAYIFGPAAPEIAVEGPGAAELISGGAADFGAVAIGQDGGASLSFTILNTGITGLPITGIVVAGGDSEDFTVSRSEVPAIIPADDDAVLMVVFNPSASGLRSTTLRIENGDANENPFTIVLTGQGLSSAQDTDGDGLNDVAELRMASFGFDWQNPDPGLVDSFQANLSAAGFHSTGQVQALRLLGPEISKESSTLRLKWALTKSSDFSTYVPFPMTVPQASINLQGELELRFSGTDNAAYYRLETD